MICTRLSERGPQPRPSTAVPRTPSTCGGWCHCVLCGRTPVTLPATLCSRYCHSLHAKRQDRSTERLICPPTEARDTTQALLPPRALLPSVFFGTFPSSFGLGARGGTWGEPRSPYQHWEGHSTGRAQALGQELWGPCRPMCCLPSTPAGDLTVGERTGSGGWPGRGSQLCPFLQANTGQAVCPSCASVGEALEGPIRVK